MIGMPPGWVFHTTVMAKDLGKSVKTIRHYLTEMKNLGLVEKVDKEDGNSKWKIVYSQYTNGE